MNVVSSSRRDEKSVISGGFRGFHLFLVAFRRSSRSFNGFLGVC